MHTERGAKLVVRSFQSLVLSIRFGSQPHTMTRKHATYRRSSSLWWVSWWLARYVDDAAELRSHDIVSQLFLFLVAPWFFFVSIIPSHVTQRNSKVTFYLKQVLYFRWILCLSTKSLCDRSVCWCNFKVQL